MGAMNGYNTGLRAREALERLKLGNAAYVNGQHFGDLSDARRLDTAEHGQNPTRLSSAAQTPARSPKSPFPAESAISS